MSYTPLRRGAQHYQALRAESAVAYASPHTLIQMMLEGLLESIACAMGHMQRSEMGKKGEEISCAMAILDGLRMSLDKNAGGEIADNLDRLYDYISRTLLQANHENRVGKLEECAALVREIKSAWEGMPREAVHAAEQVLQQRAA
ncbi:MAG: flagellar export chaperone FliS [Gammaproteobacteria bacterium]|nr:MAG: flagellar export chaperone FliS [Gammaproteobacteria bacterium]